MYIAIKGFSGAISMRKNETREIKDKKLIKDLIDAGYIEEYKTSSSKELQKEITDLKKELEDANATIEELNKQIEELKSTMEKSNKENPEDKVE